jgi:hypothetical protein
VDQIADDTDIWRYAALRNPITFARAALSGEEPDEWQKEFLRSKAKRLVLSCSRQSGKSTMAAIKALHHAIFTPNHLVIILSPSQRQSSELFHKVSDIYHHLQLNRIEPTIQETALHIKLANRSRVVSLPGSPNTVRGYRCDVALVDEAALVNPDLWPAITPSLAVSNGSLVLLSTPFGTDNYFASVCLGDDPEWTRWFINADQCPRISSAFLSKERKELGEWRFGEEYMNVFDTRNEAAYFDPLELEAALDPELEPL